MLVFFFRKGTASCLWPQKSFKFASICYLDISEYTTKALRTDFKDYANFHTSDVSPRLDYATMGLVTESAKILDIIKKTKKNLKPLDKEKVLEELGDLLWYSNLTLDELNITFEAVMENNLKRINKKHFEGDSLVRGE